MENFNLLGKNVVGVCFCSTTDRIIVGLRSGDIIALRDNTYEEFGSVSCGLLAFEPSPDGEFIVLVTGESKLLLLQTDLGSVLAERDLYDSYCSYNDARLNVGWGKKETQFHGSAGKQAALTREVIQETLLPNDDGKIRISWRQDGEYFACSFVHRKMEKGVNITSHREILIFQRDSLKPTIKEPCEGLGWALAWRSDGSLIASVQKRSKSQWVIFFENNGLRHGQFQVPDMDNDIAELYWNCNGNILAVLMSNNRLDLWTCQNYRWYLKLSIPCTIEDKLEKIRWSTNDPLSFYILFEASFARYILKQKIDRSPCDLKDFSSLVAVVDNSKVSLTPFAIANVPPPMSFAQVDVEFVPCAIALACISKNSYRMAIANSQGHVVIFTLTLTLDKPPTTLLSLQFEVPGMISEMLFLGSNGDLIILIDGMLLYWNGTEFANIDHSEIFCNLFSDNCRVFAQDAQRKVYEIFKGGQLETISVTTNIAAISIVCTNSGKILVFELEAHGNLIVNQTTQVCNDCTSLIKHPEYLCVTNSDGLVRFFPLGIDPSQWSYFASGPSEEVARLTEAGAQCIVVVPQTAALILQMPRGNLETIYPRAFVLSQVRKLLDGLRYREAFIDCRRHRIDLNLLHDHNPELFKSTLGKFVTAIPETEYLNLFISSLRDEDVSATRYATSVTSLANNIIQNKKSFPEKVNLICQKLRDELFRIDESKYAEPIITSFVCQIPPDYEAALQVIMSLDTNFIEKALKYLVFLVPAEKLYHVALGLYNLPLALSIAKRSSMDPADYMDFLNDLHRCQNICLRNYRINDHLQRYELAFKDLYESGAEFDECLKYVERHKLYKYAFKYLYNVDCVKWRKLCKLFAVFEVEQGRLDSAIDLYCFAGEKSVACELAIKDCRWQKVLILLPTSNANFSEMIDATVKNLCSMKRFEEACNLAEHYLSVDKAIMIALEGHLWIDALRLTGNNTEQVINAAILAKKALFIELQELSDDFAEKASRLEALQGQLVSELDPDTLRAAMESAEGTDICDQMSIMSMRTASTVRSSTSMLASISHATSSKSKRKADKQRKRDKPGSPFEREYLRDNVKELIDKSSRLCDETNTLVGFFAQHQLFTEAQSLQNLAHKLVRSIIASCDRLKRLIQCQEEKMCPEILAALGLTPWSIPSTLQVDHSWKTSFDLPPNFAHFGLSYL